MNIVDLHASIWQQVDIPMCRDFEDLWAGVPTQTLSQLSDFVMCLSQFEAAVLKTAVQDYWTSGSRRWWRQCAIAIKRVLSHALQHRSAADLGSSVQQAPRMCLQALKDGDATQSGALDWLTEQTDALLEHAPLFDDSQPLGPRPLRGHYESSLGPIVWGSQGTWSGWLVHGSYGSDNNKTHGYLSKNMTGQFVFRGRAIALKESGTGAVILRFGRSCNGFTGKIWFGTKCESWEGKLDNTPFKRLDTVGWAGLRNMGNTCYQSSLLQVLCSCCLRVDGRV